MNIENLLIVSTPELYTFTYCKVCGERITMDEASEHLAHCRPDVHEAIQAEYAAKEAEAIRLAS